MNCVYLANVVIDTNHIKEREPVYTEPGRLRVLEILDILSESSLFKRVHLISQGLGKKRKWYRQRIIETDGCTITYLPIVACGTLLRNLSAVLSLTLWLLRNVRRRDLVISYNFDPAKAIPVLLTQPILRFRLLIEYEELLGSLGPKYTLHKVIERLGAKIAKNFVLSSSVMIENLKLKADKKRVVIASGYMPVYSSTSYGISSDSNGELTLLYAGRLDETRGIKRFVQSFLETKCPARLLITGSGPLESYIREIAGRYENIAYLGMLFEKDFAEVIREADVCVNPQPTNLKFTNSSFPSKVTNYLTHGKIVITTKTKTLIKSPYKDLLVFYDDRDSKSLLGALDYVALNREMLLAKARKFPESVAATKKVEKKAVLDLLNSVANA